MPRLNGTGPMGMGAMTGRAQGRCTGAEPGDVTPGRGCGMGQGRGFAGRRQGGGRLCGMGPGRMGNPAGQDQATLASQITAIQERLGKLEAERDDK